MNVPIKWLQEYIDVPFDAQLLADKFTYIGYMLDRPPQEIGKDVVLDLEVRQNRSDCLSLVGLARELGAVMDKEIKLSPIQDIKGILSTGATKILIEDPDLCYRFETLTIKNVKIKESPTWLSERLETYGIKAINNIVDITNYVMVEYGIPMHAFDAQKVIDKTIIIRRAKDGENLIMFGGRKVTFTSDDLVLADSDGPITTSLMGGEEKSIHPDTTEIILEAAVYNQANVRNSSIRQDVRTESSTRLEKFLHPHGTEIALSRALKLITDIVGGEVIDHTDAYPEPRQERKITLNIKNIKRLGGIEVSQNESANILNRLEIKTHSVGDNELECEVPYFRTDLEQEADLIEEVIRIHGYDKIEEKPLIGAVPQDIQPATYALEEEARNIMIALGYDEQITEPLTFEEKPSKNPITLENSLTSEKTMLRTTLEYSLQGALQQRKKHRGKHIRLFEVGKIYFKENDEYREERHIGVLVFDDEIVDFQHVKGDIEILLDRLGYDYSDSYVHVQYCDSSTIFFDINVDLLMKQEKVNKDIVLSSPPQNVISEDFSISHAEDTQIGRIIDQLKNVDELIDTVRLSEGPIFMKDNVMKSLVTISFYSPDTSLSKKDIEPVRNKINEIIKELVSE